MRDLSESCELVCLFAAGRRVRSAWIAHDRERPGRIQHIPRLLRPGTADPRSRFAVLCFSVLFSDARAWVVESF